MNSLIQQLKDNERPFGLMSEEMKEKYREMKHEDFQVFRGGEWRDYDASIPGCNSFAYRLRPDYVEDEPEIEECEIEGCCYIVTHKNGSTEKKLLSQAIDNGCIGFKFEDGCMRNSPIYYQLVTHTNAQVMVGDKYEVLHATHVSFRRQK